MPHPAPEAFLAGLRLENPQGSDQEDPQGALASRLEDARGLWLRDRVAASSKKWFSLSSPPCEA